MFGESDLFSQIKKEEHVKSRHANGFLWPLTNESGRGLWPKTQTDP